VVSNRSTRLTIAERAASKPSLTLGSEAIQMLDGYETLRGAMKTNEKDDWRRHGSRSLGPGRLSVFKADWTVVTMCATVAALCIA
jgi:hypothetical protein